MTELRIDGAPVFHAANGVTLLAGGAIHPSSMPILMREPHPSALVAAARVEAAKNGHPVLAVEAEGRTLMRNIELTKRGLRDDFDNAMESGDFDQAMRLADDVGYPLDKADLRQKPAPAFQRIDLSDLANATYTPPDFVMERLLPRGHVTLLGGHGGAGKSMLALILAAHVVCGEPWASLPVAKLPAVFVSLEDSGDLVRNRLKKIVHAYGLNELHVADGLTILDGTGEPVLATERVTFGERSLARTDAMTELVEAVEGAGLVIIDNASDAYDGNENDRRQVRAFVRMLVEVAKSNNAAVCLLAHIDKAAARGGAAGNNYSGSTAWHNSARSRLALTGGDDAVELRQEKLNLGKAADPITLEWTDRGVLRPVAFAVRAMNDEATVLQAMREAIASGATINTTIGSAYSAAKCLEPFLPPAFAGAKASSRINRAIAALNAKGRIEREIYRTNNRKDRERWVLAQGGCADER